MKLISLNIECDKHYDLVLPFLEKEKADVVCLQEVIERDLPILERALGSKAVFEAWNYMSTDNSPLYWELAGQRVGNAIFAKNAERSGSIFYLGSKRNLQLPFETYISKEEYRQNKNIVWVEVPQQDGKIVRVASTQMPVTQEGQITPYQLEAVEKLLGAAESLTELVLCGDMNAPRGREAFDRIAAKYKDNIPAEYKTSIDQKLHRKSGIMFMVDGLFTTPRYKATNVRLVDGVSDHMAVVADIAVE